MARLGDGRSVLDRFAGTYQTARWFLGVGLIITTVIIAVLGLAGTETWLLAVGGTVVLSHAVAARIWGFHDLVFALVVDITATHASVFILALISEEAIAPAVTAVAAAVLISLFTDGWTRIALLSYSIGLTSAGLLASASWRPLDVVDDFIGVVFVATLVVWVISSIRGLLVELEAARAQTIGVVSHELRNHLAGVIGATELVSDNDVDLGEDEVEELLGLAHQQAVEAGEVIEDLLIASRAERGVLDAVAEVVDLVPMTDAVVRRSAVESREIIYDRPAEPIWAWADPLRFRQVLRNLLTNAIRYGGETIRVSIEPFDGKVSVIVADNGRGVSEDESKSIFQPYRRGRDAQQAPGSTGLGLWIARSLAEKMNGELDYRRHSGQTLFELILPAAVSAPSLEPDSAVGRSALPTGVG